MLCVVQVCEQAGTKVLQRYIQWRRLQQLMREISSHSVAKRSNAPAQAALAVDPRQVCVSPARRSMNCFLVVSRVKLRMCLDVLCTAHMLCKTTCRTNVG